ncbi:M28 family peptidase [Novipirellula artificiosorum]|uniref:Aminopeptidase YwaD n=1 Tax=Novipirellula artificiosorum TaxID=2528016 RepID=A0A5C6DIL9_9BACT|nr:M28 family peptidase [Novipirellula artificiosorum]TWU36055.1 Aminopeptidase YwaD precursor [Novipirellula artificiosorum]
MSRIAGVLRFSLLFFALSPIVFAERPITVAPELLWKIQQRADLEYLAGEELRGRGVDDDSIDVAAKYIANRFREAGLKTDLFQDQPFQKLEIPVGARAGEFANNQVRLQITPASQEPQGSNEQRQPVLDVVETLGEGMNPLAIGSVAGDYRGEVVFVGYGITAPKLGYDDYANVDAEGKAVILLRKEPGMMDPDSPFDGTKTTQHAFYQTKVENAIKHGAAAVLFVNDPGSIAASIVMAEDQIRRETVRRDAMRKQLEELPGEAIHLRETLRKRIESIGPIMEGLSQELEQCRRGVLATTEAGGFPVKISRSGIKNDKNKLAIPVLSIARDTIDLLLSRSLQRSLVEIENTIDQSYQPRSTLLSGVVVDLRVELKPANASTSNVVGEIPGRGDLASESIVLGAHYDHVGMGGYGSLAPGTVAIHNGADDNASGTVTVMAAAGLLSKRLQGIESHRRVVMIAFTGEERGLLGSRHYVDHPRFPLDSTVTMINLDMVGRLRDNELTIYGTGSGEGLDRLVENVNRQYQFDINPVQTGYGPSDHQSFYQAGIPVLFFFTGLHNDYHRPSDDFDKIDYGGLTRITDMVCDVTFQLATRADRPTYAETDKRVRIRRQRMAFLGVSLEDKPDGVVVSSLTPDGPAERAGMNSGDALDRLGNKVVQTKAEVIEALRTYSPGDSVTLHVTRESQKLAINLRLESRPTP